MGLKYPVDLVPDHEDGGFVVYVKDIPSAFSQGEDRQEALDMALSVLQDALHFNYFEQGLIVPMPSAFVGEDYIELPEDISGEVLQFNARLDPAPVAVSQ